MTTKAIEAVKQVHGAPVRGQGVVSVPAVEDMDDETFLKHLELRHPEDLEVKFPEHEDGSPRSLPTRLAFEALHSVRHRLGRVNGQPFDHEHKEQVQHERPKGY